MNKIKTFLIYLIKRLIVFLFVKTKIILLFQNKIFKYRRLIYENKSIFPFIKKRTYLDYFIITSLYFNEYYRNLKNPKIQNQISISTLSNGEGRYWANHYYKSDIGNMHRNNRQKIYKICENLINKNDLNNFNTYFINLGSSSGLDLLYFYNNFSHINYISSDINSEIINFQKENTFKKINNITTITGSVEKVVEQIYSKFKNEKNIKLIFFCNGTLQYLIPYVLEEMLINLKKIKNKFYFLSSENYRNSNNSNISFHVKNILWHHDLLKYSKMNNFRVLSYSKYQGNPSDNLNLVQDIVFEN
tara:strand:- start:180 stop:1088 length:909 start_codon:yes stop_codon:yes gene_type:complete